MTGGAFAAESSVFTNTVPALGGAVASQAVNDNATLSPFSAITVVDDDTQAMSATITITNGVNRGDFTTGSTVGLTRTVVGNDIKYTQSFASAANIGATVQTAIRAPVFQPRTNALTPTSTESTSFTVTVDDGESAPVSDSVTSVVTTSVNDTPTIGGAVANQAVNDNTTITPFSTLTVTDPDNQSMSALIEIDSGTVHGDFTSASSVGWTRTVAATTSSTRGPLALLRKLAPRCKPRFVPWSSSRVQMFLSAQPRQPPSTSLSKIAVG